MNIDQFVQANNGKYIDVDKYYGAQCWDLVELYAQQVLQIPKNPWSITLNPNGVAKNAWLNFSQNPNLVAHFNQIPKGQEQKGDICIYNGHDIYTEGHIAVCLGGGQVFEQNADPNDSPSHVYSRAPTYLLGSLRKKGTQVAYIAPETVISTFADFHVPGPTAQQITYYGNHPNGYDELHTDMAKYNLDVRLALEKQLAAQGTTLAPGKYIVP